MTSVPPYSPRVALVTGASQGIGYSIAQRLADDGLDIAVNDVASKQSHLLEVVEEIKSRGRRCIAISAVVSSEQEVKTMIAKVSTELGSLDIMVANAGIAPSASFIETTVEQPDAAMAVNIRGVFLCYKNAALQMVKEGHGGRLVGASSAAGKGGAPYLAASSGTKFAVRGITQTAVNAYAPGLINTPMIYSALAKSGSNKDRLAETKEKLGVPPNAPIAEPGVIASLVSYLCKPEADFITGQAINVCGGMKFD